MWVIGEVNIVKYFDVLIENNSLFSCMFREILYFCCIKITPKI